MKHAIIAISILIAATFALGQTSVPSTVPSTAPAPHALARAAVIEVHGEINDFTASKLTKRIEKAQAEGIHTVILDMDTPGGGVGAALDITRLLKQKTAGLHTIAYVHPTAYSAGSMISLACDEIVMAPGGVIGDCAPIIMSQSGGLEQIQGAERAKMESPIVADFEDSAERHGYDPLLVRAFVQYQVVVHFMQSPDGERRFVDEAEYNRLVKEDWKPVEGLKNPIDDASTLLTFNNTVGEKLGISKGTYATVDDLARARNLNIVATYDITTTEAFVELLGGAAVRGLLTVIFLGAIYAAFHTPGTGAPEAIAVIVGAVLFGVPLLTGYAGWLEMILILLGVALLAIELFVIPGFGITGISGIILMMCGIVLTFVPDEAPALPGGTPYFLPQLQGTWTALKEGILAVTLAMTASVILWIWLSRFLPRMPYMNRLVLSTTVGSTPEIGADAGRLAAESAWPPVGAEGIAATDLRPRRGGAIL